MANEKKLNGGRVNRRDEGSVKRLNNGAFKITISLGRDERGKQIRKYFTYRPKATTPKAAENEARLYAKNLKSKIKEGKYLSGEELTYSDVYEDWKTWAADHLTLSQREQYQDVIERVFIPEFGKQPINKITPVSMQRFINRLSAQVEPSTLRKYFTCLRSVFKYAFRLKIVQEDICSRVELPKTKKDDELQAFTIEQAKRFMNDALTRTYTFTNKYGYTDSHKIPFQFQVLYTLAIYSGCRRGELIALNWADVDYDNKCVRISKAAAETKAEGVIIKDPKTKAGKRTLTLPAVCFDLLRRLESEQRITAQSMGTAWQGKRGKAFSDQPVFIQDNGLRMHPSTVTHKFGEILKNYNAAVDESLQLPVIHMHNLRHTAASLLVSEGVDISTVARRMGHAKTSTTLNIYTHAYAENDTAASETLDKALSGSEPDTAILSGETVTMEVSPTERETLLQLRKMNRNIADLITDLIMSNASQETIISAAADMRSNVIRS